MYIKPQSVIPDGARIKRCDVKRARGATRLDFASVSKNLPNAAPTKTENQIKARIAPKRLEAQTEAQQGKVLK